MATVPPITFYRESAVWPLVHFLSNLSVYHATRSPLWTLVLALLWESLERGGWYAGNGNYAFFAGSDTTSLETPDDSLWGDPSMALAAIWVGLAMDYAWQNHRRYTPNAFTQSRTNSKLPAAEAMAKTYARRRASLASLLPRWGRLAVLILQLIGTFVANATSGGSHHHHHHHHDHVWRSGLLVLGLTYPIAMAAGYTWLWVTRYRQTLISRDGLKRGLKSLVVFLMAVVAVIVAVALPRSDLPAPSHHGHSHTTLWNLLASSIYARVLTFAVVWALPWTVYAGWVWWQRQRQRSTEQVLSLDTAPSTANGRTRAAYFAGPLSAS